MTLADRIRQHSLERYVEPARLGGLPDVTIRAGDVHEGMGLSNRVPEVCAAIGAQKFLKCANLEPLDRAGPRHGATATFRFRLVGVSVGVLAGVEDQAGAMVRESESRYSMSLDNFLRYGSGDERVNSQSIPTLSDTVVNVASVPQRSPLRYPGGKTWLIPQVRRWLESLSFRPDLFVEPFAGGAIASLTVVMEGLAERAILCERDPDIASLWRCILDNSEGLAQRVESFAATPEDVRATLSETSASDIDAAFKILLRNRISRGGILAKGASVMKQGENGQGIASRWYPETLARRIRAIGRCADRLDFFQGDGVSLLEVAKHNPTVAYFVDPPYTASGKRPGRRLYTFNEIDHDDLFERMAAVRGQFMMTYDESWEIVRMARCHGFHVAKVPMKNTHHNLIHELLVTSKEMAA